MSMKNGIVDVGGGLRGIYAAGVLDYCMVMAKDALTGQASYDVISESIGANQFFLFLFPVSMR